MWLGRGDGGRWERAYSVFGGRNLFCEVLSPHAVTVEDLSFLRNDDMQTDVYVPVYTAQHYGINIL
jgi:hypothetical protein